MTLEYIKPGIYTDLSNEAYHADPAISSTQLQVACERTYLHFWLSAAMNPDRLPPKESDALRLGSAIHCFLLEHDRFLEEYLVAPNPADYPGALISSADLKDCCSKNGLKVSGTKAEMAERIRNTVAGHPIIWDDLTAQFFKSAAGKHIVTADEMTMISGLGSALGQQEVDLPKLNRIVSLKELFTHGKAEESFFWKDPDTGLPCRCRTDWRIQINPLNLILDFKSTRSADPIDFNYDAEDRYYFMRTAMYKDGVFFNTGIHHDYWLIAAEKEKPYLGIAARYPDNHIELGRELYTSTLKKVKSCMESGFWPGYPNGLQELSVGPRTLRRHLNLEALASEKANPSFSVEKYA